MITILFQLCLPIYWTPADNAPGYEVAIVDSFPPKEFEWPTQPQITYCAKHLYEPTTVQVWGLDPNATKKYGPPSNPATFVWKLDMSGPDKIVGWSDFLAFVWAAQNPNPAELARFDTNGNGSIDATDFARFRAAFRTCVSPSGVSQVPC